MAVVLQGTKQTLRKAMSLKLRSVTETDIRSQSEAVLKHVLTSPAYQESKTVSCFLSMSGEIDTKDVAREIIMSGRKLFVPRIEKKSVRTMSFLRVYDIEDLESLPSGVWGIREPEPVRAGSRRINSNASTLLESKSGRILIRGRIKVMDDDADALDLILLPGVAFDRSLGRLGHGRGYYDSFINRYKAHCEEKGVAKPKLYALSLREQIMEAGEIPMGEFDRPVDGIITPDGIIDQDSNPSATSSIADAITLGVFDTIAGTTLE